MKNDFKEELLILVNNFLFENDNNKGAIIENIKQLIVENVKSESELLLINNLLKSKFNVEINNFCISGGKESKQLMLSLFAMLFSILSLPE